MARHPAARAHSMAAGSLPMVGMRLSGTLSMRMTCAATLESAISSRRAHLGQRPHGGRGGTDRCGSGVLGVEGALDVGAVARRGSGEVEGECDGRPCADGGDAPVVGACRSASLLRNPEGKQARDVRAGVESTRAPSRAGMDRNACIWSGDRTLKSRQPSELISGLTSFSLRDGCEGQALGTL